MSVQVLLGAAKFNGLNFKADSLQDPATQARATFTWLPVLGISGQLPLIQTVLETGFEGTLMLGWRRESMYVSGQNGSVTLYFKNALWLADLSCGPYINMEIGKRTRMYAAVGPLLMTGFYKRRTEETVGISPYMETESSTGAVFGPGVYGRTGIEFKLPDQSWMGIGLRAFAAQMDFDDLPGTKDVKGLQFMITYTVSP